MDIAKLTKILRTLGGLITLVALIWWYMFFSEVIAGSDENLFDALPCLVSSSGGCGMIVGLVSLGGGTPYNPMIFWAGIAVLAVGLIMSFSLKKTP